MKRYYKVSDFSKSELLDFIENMFNNSNVTEYMQKKYNKSLYLSFFDKAYNTVKNYKLDNLQNGNCMVKNGKEVISYLSPGYKHDSYKNRDELIEYFAGYEINCEMARLYNLYLRNN